MPHDSPIIVDGASVHLKFDVDNLVTDGVYEQDGHGHRIKKLKHKKGGDAAITEVILEGFRPDPENPGGLRSTDGHRCRITILYESPETGAGEKPTGRDIMVRVAEKIGAAVPSHSDSVSAV